MGGSNVYTVSLTMQSVASLIEGSQGNDVLAGRSSGDAYAGYAGNDRITGGVSDDLIDGGADIDTAAFSGPRSAYTLATTPYGWVSARSSAEGRDNLVAIERLSSLADSQCGIGHPGRPCRARAQDHSGYLRAQLSGLTGLRRHRAATLRRRHRLLGSGALGSGYGSVRASSPADAPTRPSSITSTATWWVCCPRRVNAANTPA